MYRVANNLAPETISDMYQVANNVHNYNTRYAIDGNFYLNRANTTIVQRIVQKFVWIVHFVIKARNLAQMLSTS